jgi:hypothetical protein
MTTFRVVALRLFKIALLLLLLLPSESLAQTAKRSSKSSKRAVAARQQSHESKLMVLPFSGTKGKAVQARVKQVLRQVGQPLAPERGAPKLDRRGQSPEQFAEALKSLSSKRNVQAFVLGDVTSQKGHWQLDLQVRSGHDGTPVGHAVIEAPAYATLLANIKEQLVDALQAPLLQSSPPVAGAVQELELDSEAPPPAPPQTAPPSTDANESEEQTEPEPAAETEELVDEPPARRRRRPRKRDPLMLGLQGGILYRSLEVADTQNPFNEFQGQRGAFPTLEFMAGFYPVAFVDRGFFANVGVVGTIEQSLGGTATIEDTDNDIDTNLFGFSVGPRIRFFGLRERGEIAISGAYGMQRMTLDFDSAAAGEAPPRSVTGSGVGGVPDVDYRFLRIGVDGSYRFSRGFGLNLDLGYRLVYNPGDDPGEISGDFNAEGEPPFFPSDEADGFDAAASVDILLTKGLDLRLGGDLRYYFHDFNVSPENQVIDSQRRPTAGGAIDYYLRGMAGLVWTPDI